MTPAWILDIFAAVMLVVAAVSAARLAAARPWQPRPSPQGAVVTDTDTSHLLMGIAMAGMLAPGLTTLPDGAWAAVFAVLAAWFGYRVMRDYRASGARALAAGHCAPHLVHSAAMVYMFLAITAPGASGGMAGMSGMSRLSVPTLAFAFAFTLAGYTIWDLDQLAGLWRGLVPAVAGASGPALAGASAGALGTGAVTGAGSRSGLAPLLDSPGTVVGCRIAMGVTMTLMLFLMI
jgi:hypothetical protein